jgi:hypothetical protein
VVVEGRRRLGGAHLALGLGGEREDLDGHGEGRENVHVDSRGNDGRGSERRDPAGRTGDGEKKGRGRPGEVMQSLLPAMSTIARQTPPAAFFSPCLHDGLTPCQLRYGGGYDSDVRLYL